MSHQILINEAVSFLVSLGYIVERATAPGKWVICRPGDGFLEEVSGQELLVKRNILVGSNQQQNHIL